MMELDQFFTLNYVDESFEEAIKKLIPKKSKNTNHRNQVRRYGSSFPYNNNIVSAKIPPVFDRFANDFAFDSVTINEYLTGQIINWHTDLGKSDIFIISLLSDSVMQFRLKEKGDVVKELQVDMPRFSLFRMTGELRSSWEHYLEAKENRISIVFRNG